MWGKAYMETLSSMTTASQNEEENQHQQIQNEPLLHSHNQQTVQCSSSSSCADTNTKTIPLSIHLSFTDTETKTEIVMKKKKRLSNSGSNGHHHHHNGVVLASLMYHFRRKRRLHRHVFPLLSVISGCFLLLFAAFSLPLHHHDNLHSVLFLSLYINDVVSVFHFVHFCVFMCFCVCELRLTMRWSSGRVRIRILFQLSAYRYGLESLLYFKFSVFGFGFLISDSVFVGKWRELRPRFVENEFLRVV